MEDDIDIEEHDVLDNPKIRDIFPDLSLVKTEAPDPEEDTEPQYDEPGEYHAEYGLNIKREHLSDDENPCQFEHNSNSAGGMQRSLNEHDQSASTSEFRQNDTYGTHEYQRETVPCEFEDNETSYNNKIIVGSKPEPDYNILYEEALNSKTSVFLENWEQKLKDSFCYCTDCAILFPTVNALDSHKSISHSFLVALNTPKPNTARKSTTMKTSRYCNHCNKIFPDDTALIKHLYELLPLNNFAKPTPEPVKIDAKSTRYKCLKCKKYFATFAGGKEHKKNAHPTLANVNIICKVLVKSENPKSEAVKMENDEGIIFGTSSLVPKSVLFQCYVCQTNFVSCYAATQHAVRCKNVTQFIKCQICKRKIRDKDEHIHTLQHKYAAPGEKLKIYTLQKYMCEKVYLKCPKCSICFDERSFRIHYERCPVDQVDFMHCNICRIDINKSRYPSHKAIHKKCTKKDFIIIKFYELSEIPTAKKPKKEEEQFEEFDEGNNLNHSFESEKIPVYYCQVCGSYKTHPTINRHKNGFCKNIIVNFCDLCGLGFSKDNYRHHREHHRQKQITLNDFKIINLKSGVEMELPMSNFHCCKRCKIHFLTKKKLHKHNCANEAYEVCKICDKKFNIKAFTPHSNFHTHNEIPELLKKYNSINDMWNVIYLCRTCNLMMTSYDSAVEHSQNHINDLPLPLSKKCDICAFEIIEKHYKQHMKLHTNNVKIDRTKFRVLAFNFEDLFSSDWMRIFSSLPKAHRYQILSKSMYRFSRRFKFTCEINGRPDEDDTKTFCKNCKTEVDMEDTNAHYFRQNCQFSSNYVCKSCDLRLNTLRDYVIHATFHDNVSKTYKVMTFKDPKDAIFEKRLRDFEYASKSGKSHKVPMKLIKSSKPIKGSFKLGGGISKLKRVSCQTVTEETMRENRIKLYKCEKCNCCVSMVKNAYKHKCAIYGINRHKMCKICKEYFYNRHLHLHMELHRQFPRIQKTPLVIRFNPDAKNILPVAIIFQCECGLHFTSKQSIDRHLEVCADDLEISKETCSKCNLLFPTDVLVTHLCKHHSKPMDINVQIIKSNTPRAMKCSDCGIIYPSTTSYDEHVFNCQAKNVNKCSECNFTFDSKTFSEHKCEINKKISVVRKSTHVSVVYRCNKCNLTYLNRKSINYHYERKHVTQRDIVTCNVCKMRFTTQTYARHKPMHSAGESFVYKIVDIKTGRSIIVKGKNKKLNKDSLVKSIKNNKSALNTTIDKDETKEAPKMDDQQNTSADEPDIATKDDVYRIHRCTKCQVCYVHDKRLQRHLRLNHGTLRDIFACEVCGLSFQRGITPRHMKIHEDLSAEYRIEVVESDTREITVLTGQNFAPTNSNTLSDSKTPINKRSSYLNDGSASKRPRRSCQSTHRVSDENYDSQDEASTSKLSIESVDMNEDVETILPDIDRNNTIGSYNAFDDPLGAESILPDIDAKNRSIDTARKFSKTSDSAHVISNKLKAILDANMRNYNSNIYRCRLCSLHFITDGSVVWHESRNHNKTFLSFACDICGLNFTYATLQRHIYIHHKTMKLGKDSFNIQVIDEIPDQILSDSDQENGNKNSEDQDQVSLPLNADDSENVDDIENANVTDDGDNTNHVENANQEAKTQNVFTENVASTQNDTKIHYYKCRNCNVCFIEESTCREHCTSHTYLDPKTYIECKICNFQFLIDSLKTHVNIHHVEEFFLENLVITEYSTGDGNPKVEVYQGIDKVQSRLVSTTTDVATDSCDTDIISI